MATHQSETDVLIVGGGIAGPALACALRDTGLRITLLEKSDAPLDTARGDHLQPHTCEILERWGVIDEFFAAGAEKRRASVWMRPDGETIMVSSLKELPIPHPYFIYLNHETISTTLLDLASQSPRFEMIRPIRNFWLESEPDEAPRVRVALPDGAERTITAALMVGADGRASRTRKFAGIDAVSHRYENSIGVLFAKRLDQDPDNAVRVFLTELRIISVIPRTGGGCKIGIPMQPAEAAEWRRADPAELERRLAAMIPALHVTGVRFGDIYPPIYLRTGRWAEGNIVLIGDACHAMHPARSQGMNISIRCIDALAARLRELPAPLDAAAVRPALAAYEAEARPAIDALLETNHRQGLEMDELSPQQIEASIESARKLQANPAAMYAYSMRAAGYAHRLDSQSRDTQKKS